MLTTKDLIAKLQELDPEGTMRVVIPADEYVGAEGEPTNVADPHLALAGEDIIGNIEWRGQGLPDETVVVVLGLGGCGW